MFAFHELVFACVLLPFAAPTPFQRRGNHTLAPDWNSTIQATTSHVETTTPLPVAPTSKEQPPYPIIDSGRPLSIAGTGTGITSDYGYAKPTGQGSTGLLAPSSATNATSPSSATNATSPSCTVNVPQATIDWWYAATYAWNVGSWRRFAANVTDGQQWLTYVPNTATFDVTEAMSEVAYTDSLSYDPDWDITWTYYEEYTVTPSATSTSIVSRIGYSPLPSNSAIPEGDVYLYEATPSPASVAFTSANSTVFVATSTTPVLYFSAYEVETVVPVTADDGGLTSTTITETINLPQTYAYEYWIKGIENSAMATGTVPSDFLQQIPQSSCGAGEFQATVTVLIVVDVFYRYFVIADPFLIHIESSVLGFDDTTSDPPIVVADNTDKGTKKPTIQASPTNNVPIIESPASGFSTAPETPKPGKSAIVQTPSASSSARDSQQGDVSPGKAPDAPEPTQHTVGTIGIAPVVIGSGSVVVVGSQTVQPGGAPITVGGVEVSLAPSATAIIVGGSRTSILPPVLVPAPQPRPPPILTIGSSTLTPNAATQFFISPGQTLTPGGSATLDNTVISLATSANFIVVGGSTQILPTGAAPVVATNRPSVVVGGSTFTANPGSSFVIGTQTLAPGQQLTVGSTTLSLGSSFVVINGATSTFVNPGTVATTPPEITFGGSTFTANPSNAFVIDGQTLAPGQQIVVDSKTISLGSSASGGPASVFVIDGVTSTFANPAISAPTRPEITVGSSTFTANPGNTFVINGQTLTPAGSAITVDGTTLSLGPSASFVVVNGVTSTIASPTAQITPPPLTIGNGIFTALPGTGTTYMIGGFFLTPGGIITVADTTISLAPGATALVINGVTTILNPQSPITNPPLLTIGSETFTAAPGTGTTFIIDGQTLTPGGVITVDGTTISLAPGATELIYGISGRSTTTALFPATTTRGQSVTTTNSEASAGATGGDGAPAATKSQKGAGHHTRGGGIESWALSIILGLIGLVLG